MNDRDITITRGRWWWKRQETYRGSGTVWHRYPDGKRAPSWLEAELSDRWQAAQWADVAFPEPPEYMQ